MTLSNLAIGLLLTLVAAFFLNAQKRAFFIFIFSLVAVYALQPALPIRYIDFWLPTIGLVLVIVLWIVITPHEIVKSRENIFTFGWILLVIVILGMTRYLDGLSFLTASIPPRIEQIMSALVVFGILILFAIFWAKNKSIALGGIILVISLLIAIKYQPITIWLAQTLRSFNNQAIETVTAFDIRWLGLSYIAFRLIHTLQDSIRRRGPTVFLQEYVTFIFFYPALVAGPIDRLERFVKDLRAPFSRSNIEWGFIIERLALGLFKKYILADSLALVAINPQNATQIQNAGWAWVLLYAYAFQILLDFSGYTDIALALGRLIGIKLPENFKQPYLKPNLTHFWNNWHMSLTQWFRAYVFNPFSRSLRGTSLPAWGMILLAQLLTMTLIGLWHGITPNFVIWGLWHGLGLFFHSRWQNVLRVRVSNWATTPMRQQVVNWSGILITFNFVALGWVWFVLPTPQKTLDFFSLLFRFG
ncbi:MAG: MBOAT family protein [Anaerolineales bacterium]|nr:MBOAT family protein [Chloroflexota bacterium]MBL6983761.1 MBOAT family protein [Anaerolineales bacterium]